MKISMIAAVSNNGVIGYNNKLPWHISDDMRHFKSITLGKVVVMGRKTFESLKKPLSERVNVVITRDRLFTYQGVYVVFNIEEALLLSEKMNKNKKNEIMVIGGEQIYRLALNYVQRIYMTRVHKNYKGDSFFPELSLDEWQTTSCEEHVMEDGDNKLEYSFVILDRCI